MMYDSFEEAERAHGVRCGTCGEPILPGEVHTSRPCGVTSLGGLIEDVVCKRCAPEGPWPWQI